MPTKQYHVSVKRTDQSKPVVYNCITMPSQSYSFVVFGLHTGTVYIQKDLIIEYTVVEYAP